MPSPFIQANNLQRHYLEGGRRHKVLDGAALTVGRGETIALLGRSGSGKSTLLNLISGIDRPDAGSVVIDGVELTSLSERERTLYRRRNIGFIYQFFNLIPTLTCAENIALVLELNKTSARKTADQTRRVLNAVGLVDRADSFPDQLSGGEQQRVAIARALVHQPQLILADEPTGNLDAASGRQVLALLHDLVVAQQGTLVIVTHSLAVANCADRIMTLDEGRVAERVGDFAW